MLGMHVCIRKVPCAYHHSVATSWQAQSFDDHQWVEPLWRLNDAHGTLADDSQHRNLLYLHFTATTVQLVCVVFFVSP